MTDFLLELRSEEIPARMQARAREDLARLFTERLTALGVTFGDVVTYATPRRLALIVRDLPQETAASSEERKGPRADAPAPAIDGFLRSTGLTRDQLVERDDGKGGKILFAVIRRPGLPVPSVLASACHHVVHAFPWPKAMRWGDASASTESLRWVRPLHGIVALFGPAIVPFEVAGVASGAVTKGHRFHHPGDITIGSAADYVEKLRACHVIVDPAERAAIIATGATMLTAAAGLTLVRDEGLLAENAGLTEWPVPLLGRFDPAFLDVPPEVIQLTARVNQKYFVCIPPQHGEGDHAKHGGGAGEAQPNPSVSRDAAATSPIRGGLADAFVCVANVDAADGGTRIVEGNRKVLAARLSDARFFYDTDLKTKLEDLRPRLEKIVFHEKLGTVADKVDRVAKLARWLVEEGIVNPPRNGEGDHAQHGGGARSGAVGGTDPSTTALPRGGPPPQDKLGEDRRRLADQAERAARLCKADLVTGMVGEFPELQGLMGGYYAAAQGEDPTVAAAIRDHYKPVGQGDAVPTDPVTVAVSLADKLDTLTGFFSINEKPTGSKDPFALRRAIIGIAATVLRTGVRGSLRTLVLSSYEDHLYGLRAHDRTTDRHADQRKIADEILAFAIDRLKVQQREAGVRHDLIDAVFALGGEDDLVRLLARVRALQAFVGTDDGANLLAGYKRAANILKKEGFGQPQAVIPAKAGIHSSTAGDSTATDEPMDSRLRGNDGGNGAQGGAKTLSYTPEKAESALIAALDAAEPAAAAAVAAEDFEAAMTALATLRAPIDAFFDSVTVNDPDPAKRAARLALLARARDAVHTVADFSKIEG